MVTNRFSSLKLFCSEYKEEEEEMPEDIACLLGSKDEQDR